jgi:hypothetical protein
MRTVLLLAGLLFPLMAAPQDIYRWVDKDGIVHYADQPGAPDAELVDVGGIAREPRQPDGTATPLYQPEAEPEPAGPAYGFLRIASPAADQVFTGGDASSVSVQVETDGDLRSGDQLMIFVDGNRVPGVSGTSATLTGLTRGTHFLRAAIADANGNVVITSPQITFHTRQASIASPPTGPAISPRPPPPGPRPTPLPSRGG